MNSRVVAGGPASACLQEEGVGDDANKDLPLRAGHLGMTAQAKVWITLREHFTVHRTVRAVAGHTTFPHRRMLKHDRAGLSPMTLRTGFIQAGHGQSARRFENVAAVGIVALDTIEMAFQHRMMMRQLKFALDCEVALQAGRWILARVDDEFVSAARFNVFAARPVT